MENSSQNNVDDIFKKTFEGFENEPSERVWGNVREALKTRVKRGFYASFMGALLLLGVGGILTYSIVNNGSVSQVADKAAVSKASGSAPALANSPVAPKAPVVADNNTSRSGLQATNALNPANTPAANVNNPGNPVKPLARKNNTSVIASNDQPGVEPAKAKAQINPETSYAAVTAEGNTVEAGEKVASEATPEIASEQADKDEETRKAAETAELKKKETEAMAYNPKAPVVKAKMRRAPFTNPNKSGFAVIAFYSPEVAYRTLSAGKNPNLENMVIVRNKFEKASYAYSYGLKFEYQFKKHLALQVGISYGERGEAARYDFTGSTTMKVGPFNQDVTVTNNSPAEGKSFNKYRYIEVPVTASYWLGKGRSLFAVSGGVSIGDLVGADVLQLVTHTGNDNMQLNKAQYTDLRQTNYSALLGFSYSYMINTKFSIMLDPVLRYSLNGPNKMVQVKEHQYSTGINVGLRYQFNNN
jgi:hypothetical protein